MKTLKTSFLVLMIMSLITGLIYPLMITGIAQLTFSKKANGSMIAHDGHIVGSELIGQEFSSPGYFHGRPSVNNYDGLKSGGSNLGPSNRSIIERTVRMSDIFRKENGLEESAMIPSEMVLASASGLDPHISVESAFLQISRISKNRGIPAAKIMDLVNRNAESRYLFFGERFVNVLRLNLALTVPGNKND